MRLNNRALDALRPAKMLLGIMPYAEGSCLVEMGATRVICAATVQAGVPAWLANKNQGWLTAEYAMLPRSTQSRVNRSPNGRSQEIQRLIGRSLRAMVDLTALGPYTIQVDCDVLQADGGTRTAAISGGSVAVYQALQWMQQQKIIQELPIIGMVAAVSVGKISNQLALDLDYSEDSSAEVDMNVVMRAPNGLIEVQGTAEHGVFSLDEQADLIKLAASGIEELFELQKVTLQGNN